MQKCCIRFIRLHKFSQIRRNDIRQSALPCVTFNLNLDCGAIQNKYHLIRLRLKSQQN